MTQGQFVRRVAKPVLFVGALVPFLWTLRDTLTGHLGANPIENLTHRTGLYALTFVMIALSVTPARRLTGLGALVNLRRMFGLFAFFYAALHFSIYFLDQTYFSGTGLSLHAVAQDIAKRPYITVGFTAFLILCALAATSMDRMIKRLGGRRWQRLHQLVYVAAALAVLHFLWLVKADVRLPSAYGIVLVALLSFRLVRQRARARQAAPRRPGRPGTAALESS